MYKLSLPLIVILLLFASISSADQYVSGYYRSDGTYVQGYQRSSPNSDVKDNYSYKGNINPYTSERGSSYYRNNPTSGYYGTSSGSSSWGSTYYGSDYYSDN